MYNFARKTLKIILELTVLKAIENAGIRHIRGSEDYNTLVEKEIKKTRLAKIIRVRSSIVSMKIHIFVAAILIYFNGMRKYQTDIWNQVT